MIWSLLDVEWHVEVGFIAGTIIEVGRTCKQNNDQSNEIINLQQLKRSMVLIEITQLDIHAIDIHTLYILRTFLPMQINIWNSKKNYKQNQ